ncbi:MAG: glycosyl transferase family 90 [Planctomycetaceae bacterium]
MRFDLSPRHSQLVHRVLAGAKLPVLEWWAARHVAGGFPRPRIRIVARAGEDAAWNRSVDVRKRRGRIERLAIDRDWARSREGFSTLLRRVGIFVRLLSDPAVPDGDWRADVGDSVPGEGPVLGFCTCWRDTILVPDRGFVTKRGYERERRAGRAAAPFADRDPAIVWRGSPTGIGEFVTDPLEPAAPGLKQRVALCLRLRDRPRSGPDAVDVRIARGRLVDAGLEARYAAAGILGEFVPQRSWCCRRFAIDVDGNSNAFSNLFIRLLYGCCVIRVDSPRGYRQWYHDRLVPGRHYVPVAADLSDLDAVIDWCRDHPADCAAIAREGQRVALEMTYSGEMQRTIEMIARHSPPRPTAATSAASWRAAR